MTAMKQPTFTRPLKLIWRHRRLCMILSCNYCPKCPSSRVTVREKLSVEEGFTAISLSSMSAGHLRQLASSSVISDS